MTELVRAVGRGRGAAHPSAPCLLWLSHECCVNSVALIMICESPRVRFVFLQPFGWYSGNNHCLSELTMWVAPDVPDSAPSVKTAIWTCR